MNRRRSIWTKTACVLVAAGTMYGQRGVGDWMTGHSDAQRSSWVRNDAKISVASVLQPGFQLDWKLKLADVPLTPPVMIDFYIGFRGFRSLGFAGSTANGVTGIDTDLGRMEWQKTIPVKTPQAVAASGCPGGMTAGVTRAIATGYPPPPTGRTVGRGSPAKSGVGEPLEGAVTLKPVPPPVAAPVVVPATTPPRRVALPPSPFVPRVQYVHAISADGRLHSFYLSNGEEPDPALDFLPPNTFAQGLMVFDGKAYATTANRCGGVADGVWALDLKSKKAIQWKSRGNVAGSGGAAVSPDGTLFVAAGKELVALDGGTLKEKGAYSIAAGEFSSSPVVFPHKDQDLVAAVSGDGRLHVVDGAAVSKPIAVSPVFGTPGYAAGALATWQDAAGTRWILVPTAKAIATWKLVDQDGGLKLQAGWVSREMVSPLPPLVINDVVFAVSGGDGSTPAVLYAFDALTGKEIWSSGSTISSMVRTGGLAAGGSRVYVSGQDGTQYAFGFPIEH